MKRVYKISILFFWLFIVAQSHIIYAQNPRKHQKFAYNATETPTFGLKGGALLSTIKGDAAIDQHGKKLGFQIGITGALYFNPQFSVRGELNYEMKGGLFETHDMQTDLNYASLPIYLKFNFTEDPEIYIYGGGYVSYLLIAKTKGTYEKFIGPDNISESINENILPYLNKLDAGIIAGMGVQGRFNSNTDIFLDFRYTYGFIGLDNGEAEYRYNFNYLDFWPEQELDNPTNMSLMFTTGFIYFIDAR